MQHEPYEEILIALSSLYERVSLKCELLICIDRM